MARVLGLFVLVWIAWLAEASSPRDAQLEILKMDTREQAAPAHHWHHTEYTSHAEIMTNLKKDADNQKAIMATKHSAHRAHGDSTSAASMSPHLSMHSTRGEEAEGRHRGRAPHEHHVKTQKSIHGVLKLPPDEATPFFETYVLQYAFPTIAVICTCLACVLYRTMRMYQKERWKGTSYFHGARRSAESLLPGLK